MEVTNDKYMENVQSLTQFQEREKIFLTYAEIRQIDTQSNKHGISNTNKFFIYALSTSIGSSF